MSHQPDKEIGRRLHPSPLMIPQAVREHEKAWGNELWQHLSSAGHRRILNYIRQVYREEMDEANRY